MSLQIFQHVFVLRPHFMGNKFWSLTSFREKLQKYKSLNPIPSEVQDVIDTCWTFIINVKSEKRKWNYLRNTYTLKGFYTLRGTEGKGKESRENLRYVFVKIHVLQEKKSCQLKRITGKYIWNHYNSCLLRTS